MITTGDKEYFKNIGKIPFEGKESDNPLAFKYYDENQKVGDKTMKEHFRFAVCYWHTFTGLGADPFGAPTQQFPWLENSDPVQQAKDKMDAAFEFITKIGAPYYCFHDYDLIAEGPTLAESERRLDIITDYAREKMDASGVKLLWGTANCFGNPRYMNGAATKATDTKIAQFCREFHPGCNGIPPGPQNAPTNTKNIKFGIVKSIRTIALYFPPLNSPLKIGFEN